MEGSDTKQEENNIPEDANEGCPGTNSKEAGKKSACAGCPNQKNCASGEPQPVDPGSDQSFCLNFNIFYYKFSSKSLSYFSLLF